MCPQLALAAPRYRDLARSNFFTATPPGNQDTTRGLANLNPALGNTLKTALLSTAWPKGQRCRTTGDRPFPCPAGPRTAPAEHTAAGLARSFLGAPAHGISATAALSPQPRCFIQAPSSPSRSLTAGATPPFRNLSVKEGTGGGTAQPVLYCSSSRCNAAHCPSVLAMAGPYTPQHTHPHSKTTDPRQPHT